MSVEASPWIRRRVVRGMLRSRHAGRIGGEMADVISRSATGLGRAPGGTDRVALPPILSDPKPGMLSWSLYAAYDLCWLLAILLSSPWWIVPGAFWVSTASHPHRRWQSETSAHWLMRTN